MKTLEYEIIVSRYNENIDWVKKYNNCKVYNKGDHFDGFYHKLNNIGREAHTYLYHIVNNYDKLSDYTFFVQGHPFDHSPNFFNIVDDLITKDFQEDFLWISERIIEGDFEYKREPYTWPGFPNIKLAYEFVFESDPKKETFLFGAGAQFVCSKERIRSKSFEFYQRLLDFFVEENSDEFYIKLLRRPNNDITIIDVDRRQPEMAYYMERFWGIILNDV